MLRPDAFSLLDSLWFRYLYPSIFFIKTRRRIKPTLFFLVSILIFPLWLFVSLSFSFSISFKFCYSFSSTNSFAIRVCTRHVLFALFILYSLSIYIYIYIRLKYFLYNNNILFSVFVSLLVRRCVGFLFRHFLETGLIIRVAFSILLRRPRSLLSFVASYQRDNVYIV